MMRTLVRIVVAVALIGSGWALGRAQSAQPDFEIIVTAQSTGTSVECHRGCALAWVERGVNPAARRSATFSFNCSGDRCSSGRIGGWLQR